MNRILLVDDEPAWLEQLKRALPGCDVDAARTYEEAEELLGKNEAYDVAVVDLNLIDGGDELGGKLLTLLRKSYPLTRRIALSGTPPGSVWTKVFNLYAVDELLLKNSMTLQEFRQAVETALQRRLTGGQAG